MSSRRCCATSAAASMFPLGAPPRPASAEAYPSRPITVIWPFAAGGPGMALLRILEPRMAAALGQPLVIDTISGAAGSIGTGRLARAAPDGYTVGRRPRGRAVVNASAAALSY